MCQVYQASAVIAESSPTSLLHAVFDALDCILYYLEGVWVGQYRLASHSELVKEEGSVVIIK